MSSTAGKSLCYLIPIIDPLTMTSSCLSSAGGKMRSPTQALHKYRYLSHLSYELNVRVTSSASTTCTNCRTCPVFVSIEYRLRCLLQEITTAWWSHDMTDCRHFSRVTHKGVCGPHCYMAPVPNLPYCAATPSVPAALNTTWVFMAQLLRLRLVVCWKAGVFRAVRTRCTHMQ